LFKVYLLGNSLFEQDSLPVKLLPKLQKNLPNFEFAHLDPTENLPEQEHLILIDTILNSKKICTLSESEIEKIQKSPTISMHDFDLGLQLRLAKKLGQIKKVTIIGVPPQTEKNEKEIIKKISEILSTLA